MYKYLVAKNGFDTAENGPSKVPCKNLIFFDATYIRFVIYQTTIVKFMKRLC